MDVSIKLVLTGVIVMGELQLRVFTFLFLFFFKLGLTFALGTVPTGAYASDIMFMIEIHKIASVSLGLTEVQRPV